MTNILQVRSSATEYSGTTRSTLSRMPSELTKTMDSLQRHRYEQAIEEGGLLAQRILRIVEATEDIAHTTVEERDDDVIMSKIKDLAKVLEGDDGMSSPTKRAIEIQEEADMNNPGYLAWSLTQYIRNSILVRTHPPNPKPLNWASHVRNYNTSHTPNSVLVRTHPPNSEFRFPRPKSQIPELGVPCKKLQYESCPKLHTRQAQNPQPKT